MFTEKMQENDRKKPTTTRNKLQRRKKKKKNNKSIWQTHATFNPINNSKKNNNNNEHFERGHKSAHELHSILAHTIDKHTSQ